MTKEEAAEALGVAPRTVERYVAQGLLHPKYKKGVRGKAADFSEREVKNLKKQLSTKEVSKPVIVPVYRKLTLSLEEAAALAGLPKDFLEQAIEEGDLKVVKRDGKLSIKRKDLEQFVEKL
jgi:excisionase family DNA binding protein